MKTEYFLKGPLRSLGVCTVSFISDGNLLKMLIPEQMLLDGIQTMSPI
jgi:hypothetical protein